MLLKGSPPSPKLFRQCLAMKLSFIFEFQLAPFAFSNILGEPFTVSPPKVWGEGTFFPQKAFHREINVGVNLWRDYST